MKIINKIIYVVTLATIIALGYLITRLNILPNKYYIPIIILLIIWAVLLFFIGVKSKKKVLNIIAVILMVISIGINCFGSYYVYNTNRLFSSISEAVEKKVYYVVVKKDSKYSKLSDLNGKTMALFDTESTNYNKALNQVKKSIKTISKKYEDMNAIVKDLLDSTVDSVLINSSNKEILDEAIPDFKNNTKVIKKITISVKKTSSNKKNSEGNFNILVSGIDTYGDINTISRSDVNIVLTINSKNHELVMTSVPRDMQVQLHGTTGLKDKLTHAGIYGIDMSRTTLEDFLETNIDYYIRVNFDSVVQLVDAIGGIDINNDVAFRGSTRYFNTGAIHLNGKQALEYSRERYKMPYGDWTRGLHQEEVIRAVFSKIATSTELLTNYSEIITSLQSFFQTNIPSDLIKKYVKNQLNDMTSWEVNSYAVGGSGYDYQETYSMPGIKLYVTLPNEEHRLHASKVINSVLNGKKYKDISW
ncbi:MAG: LCP family protein [Bacilli bacterium]|nr:LCP family protein [Bacilli bacterium]